MVFVFLLMALFGASALIFAVQNPQPVALAFLAWQTISMPVSFVLLVSAFVGVLAASVSGFAEKIRLQLRVRDLERQVARLTAERSVVVPVREPVPVRPRVAEPVPEPAVDPVDGRRYEPARRVEVRPP